MLPLKQINTALFNHWSSSFTEPTTTIFPGQARAATQQREWIELWTSTYARSPQRRTQREALDVSVVVHCYSRRDTNLARAQELADVTRDLLEHHTLEIKEHAQAGAATVGHLTILESDTHDLTRNHASVLQEPLSHLVLTFRAVAHESN